MKLAPKTFFSPFMWPHWLWIFSFPRGGYLKGLVRYLYIKHVDELYIPRGTKASITFDGNRKPARPGKRCIKIDSTSPHRKGMQEVYFFEEFGYKR